MRTMRDTADCEAYLREKAKIIDATLADYLERQKGTPDTIRQAMAYSLLGGGKRVRPAMLLAANELTGGSEERALPFACAIEIIHAYSLIHDDLPCMDNDTLRHGKPTNHVVYGDAMALLAGDALLNLAYEIMIDACIARGVGALRTAQHIAEAAGSRGMIGGQSLDILSTGKFTSEADLQDMHLRKTGALLSAAVLSGIALNDPDDNTVQCMREYGYHLGMLFQITDDILDCEGSVAELGKSVGKDAEESKTTYVTLYGLDRAKQLASEHAEHAEKSVVCLKNGAFFRLMAQYILHRKK